MVDREIIDLTDSPISTAVAIPQDVSSESSSMDPPHIEIPTQRQRKRKRKQKFEAQSQDSTAVNTRNNSEEDIQGGISMEYTRQVRRKHEDRAGIATKTGASDSILQDGMFSSKKQENKADSSSSLPVGNTNPGDIFFEDITPAVLPPNIRSQPPPTYDATVSAGESISDAKLLLPAHVSVLGSTPVEILPPTESDEEGHADYIKYLDYGGDRQREFFRYFEEPEDESLKLKRTVCKNCGAEGDHKTADCRVLICLTCGARDEHVTKSCPVSKVCFSCGMKGHINSNCPNRRMGRTKDHGNSGCCSRCYSDLHQTSECPTWWRIYLYVTNEDRSKTLSERRSKRDLELGKGGEGYIAEDEWCYNCGEVGHWGDDCKSPCVWNKPAEPSAFGIYNLSTGPFYDLEGAGPSTRRERRLRDWEREEGAWNMNAPDGIGRQGRRKEIEKMRKKALMFEEMNDPQDWFANARNSKNRGMELDRDKDRQSDRDKDRYGNRDGNRQRVRERDKGDRRRERDWERGRDRERGRVKEKERSREGGRDRKNEMSRERNRDRAREKEREHEQGRRFDRDPDKGRDQASSGSGGGKFKINISQSLGAGRNINPPRAPAPSSLSTRTLTEPRPSLLDRISVDSVVHQFPRQKDLDRSSGSSIGAFSIKGAGRRQGNDIDGRGIKPLRGQPGPRYQGGYSR